jgi:hypothetical protein
MHLSLSRPTLEDLTRGCHVPENKTLAIVENRLWCSMSLPSIDTEGLHTKPIDRGGEGDLEPRRFKQDLAWTCSH